MSGKTYLVIDPDETVSNIIKKSIQGYDPAATIMMLGDMSNASTILDASKVDCMISDSICLLDHGIEEFFQNYVTSKKLDYIIITTYGDGFAKLPDKIKDDYPIISKPIDLQAFQPIIQKISGPIKSEIVQQASLTSEQYSYCQKVLFRLKSSIGARCIFLSDSVGHVLAAAGDSSGLSVELITSLLGGGIATLLEAGKSLDDESQIHLTFREGSKFDLYAVNVGKDILLIIIINKTPGFSRLGSTWYYARQCALTLAEYLLLTAETSPAAGVGSLSTQTIDDELDKLFGG
jgi:hypothetical protein